MANAIKWATPASRTSGFSNASVNAAAVSLGSEIDNTTNKDQFMTLELAFTPAAAPAAGGTWRLYVICAVDGTNYEIGDAEPTSGLAAIFGSTTANAAQKPPAVTIPIPPFKFKLLLVNGTSQNATAVYLLAYTHNDEVQ